MELFREPANNGLDCRLFGYLLDMEENNAFVGLNDVYIISLAPGYAECEIPIGKDQLDEFQLVDTGVCGVLAIECMVLAAKSLNHRVVMSTFSCSFTKDVLLTKGMVLRGQGEATCVGELITAQCEIRQMKTGAVIGHTQAEFVSKGSLMEQYIAFSQSVE